MPDKQGKQANITGSNLERFISGLVEQAGYRLTDATLFKSLKCMEQPIYAKQFPIGHDLYGRNRKCDFILYHPTKHPNNLVIESKWQQTSGSAEEKLPFLFLTIQHSKTNTSVVLDGSGFSKNAERWLRSKEGDSNLQQVFNMQQFQKFANNGQL